MEPYLPPSGERRRTETRPSMWPSPPSEAHNGPCCQAIPEIAPSGFATNGAPTMCWCARRSACSTNGSKTSHGQLNAFLASIEAACAGNPHPLRVGVFAFLRTLFAPQRQRRRWPKRRNRVCGQKASLYQRSRPTPTISMARLSGCMIRPHDPNPLACTARLAAEPPRRTGPGVPSVHGDPARQCAFRLRQRQRENPVLYLYRGRIPSDLIRQRGCPPAGPDFQLRRPGRQ